MSAADSEAKILNACSALGQLEAFSIGEKPRYILVACMEFECCYTINFWVEDVMLANEAEAFLKAQNITSYRTPEDNSGDMSLGYTVNAKREAAFTVSKIKTILKIADEPRQKAPLVLTKSQVRPDWRGAETAGNNMPDCPGN